MALNNCIPEELFGPISQHLFLGCSIVDISCTAGFSDQPTDVTVTLAQDTCPASAEHPKIYYDRNLDRQTTTLPDPGFLGDPDFGNVPIIGCSAYLRFGTFEFCGIIQSWEAEVSSNVNKGYVVKLTSPLKILEQAQIIIAEYSGPVKNSSILFSNSIVNLINAYGFAEKLDGLSCPLVSQTSPGVYNLGDSGIDGATFGTAGGGFGGANANDNGMQWSVIKDVVSVLTSAFPKITNDWSPHGRLLHKGVNLGLYGNPWNNGYGLISADAVANGIYCSEYYLDLSEMPVPPSYFRFSGVSISLLEAINRVCQECGYEYFIELLPIKNSALSLGGVAKIIKIRGINRINQASLNGIQGFIDEKDSDGTLIASSLGRELRDDITSTFLIGGPKQTLYQAYQTTDPEGDGNPANPEDDDMILPYFGVDSSGNMMVPYLTQYSGVYFGVTGFYNTWQFNADTTEINLSLQELQLINPVSINENELRFSTELGTWEKYIQLHETDTYVSISGELPEAEISSKKLDAILDNVEGKVAARDYEYFNMAHADIQNLVLKRRTSDKEKIYQWISNFANEYYGQKFAVRVPYSCAVLNAESQIITYSEQPSNDGGWTEVSDVLGLPNPTFYTDFFSNDQNKIGPFARFNGANEYDLSQFSPDDYIVYGDNLYIRASVEERYVFHDRFNQLVPRVVVSLPGLVRESEESDATTFSRIHAATEMRRVQNPPDGERKNYLDEIYNTVAAQHIYLAYGRNVYYPDAVAIPMKSNVNNYGPWYSVGPAGGIRVEKNDGLVPWQYGDYSTLNTAAQALADAGNVNTQITELGSVTVAGYPELPLGAEINSLATLAGQQLVENRSAGFDSFNGTFVGGQPFTYQYLKYGYGFSLQGNLGPSVGNISITIGPQGLQTTYNMRTYTPQFGRFAQLNAERLSQIGQQRMAYNRDLRAFLFQRDVTKNRTFLADSDRSTFRSVKSQSEAIRKVHKGLTPHEVFVGQNLTWNSGNRSIIASESLRDVVAELATGISGGFNPYAHKSFMSIDGLLRPVSMGGDGGLPRYVVPSGGTSSLQSFVGDRQGNISGAISGIPTLDIHDFNPFFNPSGYAFSDLSTKHTGTLGHDIDILGRGTSVPSGGMILKHGPTGNGIGYDYRNDYRGFALRGPLLIHGWGYDTQGKPIPNQVDNEINASGGVFQTSGLSDNFLPNFGQKSHTWPLGALDVRFDRSRGLWVAPVNIQKTYGELLGHLGPNNGIKVRVLSSGSQFLDGSGNITGYTIISGYTKTNDYNVYASGCRLEFQLNDTSNRWEVNSESILPVLITGTISAGTWNSSVSGIVPFKFTAPLFTPYYTTGTGSHNPSGVLSYTTGVTVTGWNRYTESLTVTAGQAYIGKIVNGWWEGAQCEAITL